MFSQVVFVCCVVLISCVVHSEAFEEVFAASLGNAPVGLYNKRHERYKPEYPIGSPVLYNPYVPAPIYRPPVYRPPVQRPPIYRPPIYRPPVRRPPVYRPPGYGRPRPGVQPRGGLGGLGLDGLGGLIPSITNVLSPIIG